jgi:two-component system chemotaxis response regulator CheY
VGVDCPLLAVLWRWHMNILVVDDNRDYRFLLDLALGQGGYEVHSAEDGLEGIEILESTDIDLIISDIRMPRMDGIKLNAYARATPKYKNTKFIFVSGFKEVYASSVVLDSRLDFFLDKTTSSEEILKLVHKLLDRDPKGELIETR